MGTHLRIAADAAASRWPGCEAQAPTFIPEAKATDLTTIYLATGSAKGLEQFRQDGARANLTIFVKEDL